MMPRLRIGGQHATDEEGAETHQRRMVTRNVLAAPDDVADAAENQGPQGAHRKSRA